MEGAIQTFVFKHPSLPNVWLVMSNTNFTRMKLWVLKKQVFIYQNIRSHLKDFLGSWNLLEVMINNQEPPFKIGKAPSKYDQKSFQWSEPNKLDDYKWESTNLMDVSILHHIDLPPLEIEHVYIISIFGSMLHGYVCDVTMRCYLACSCFDFISMLSFSIGNKEKYVLCKHLYFIFAKRMSCDPKIDIFIHQLTLSWNEVHCLLLQDNICA